MRSRRWSSTPVLALLLAVLGGCSGPNAEASAAVEPAPAASSSAASSSAVPVVVPVARPVAAPAAAAVGAPRVTGLPPGVAEPPPATTQLVTVLAPAAASATATLQAWQREPAGGWRVVRGPLRVRVGTDGVGQASERSRRTPRGSFSLDQAFGRLANPGTRLPYRRVGDQDWWVSDARSPAYNTYRHCSPGTCPFDEGAGENLGRSGPSYGHALVIGYNTAKPVAGAGSAFFLHVDAGVASAGCVEVPRADVVALLRWLDPGQRPRITIGIG